MIRSRDRNNDGMLNIAEFVTLLLTRNRINRNKELFEQVDINDDGVITRAEAMKSRKNGNNEKIIHEIFQLIDINNDDKITFEELTSVMDGNSGAQQHSGTQVRRKQNLAHQLITLIDQNFDQRLSLQEVQNFADANKRGNRTGILREFEYIDSNRDGFLTINEIIKEPEKIAALVHFQEPPPVINN
ncbi:EF-hand domain pair family protein [Acanthocheilonema viteae]